MAVTAGSNDPTGAALDAKIATLVALKAAGTAGSVQDLNLYKEIRSVQRQAVIYYIDRNRIDSAVILSTLS